VTKGTPVVVKHVCYGPPQKAFINRVHNRSRISSHSAGCDKRGSVISRARVEFIGTRNEGVELSQGGEGDVVVGINRA
jgi:hypothetical protein